MLEAVVASALVEPGRDDLGAGGQDDGEVGQVYALAERQQVGNRESVSGLEDECGCQVAVADHGAAGGPLGADLSVEVVVAVRRDQTGERVAGHLVDQSSGQGADRACGRLGGDVDGVAALEPRADIRVSARRLPAETARWSTITQICSAESAGEPANRRRQGLVDKLVYFLPMTIHVMRIDESDTIGWFQV